MTDVHITRTQFAGLPGPAGVPSGGWLMTLQIDGVALATDFATGISDALDTVFLGDIYGYGEFDAYRIDDFKVGTGGFGSSDLFSDAFSGATLVPPFDSNENDGDDFLTIDSGNLRIVNPSVDPDFHFRSWLTRTLALGDDFYMQCKVKFDSAMVDAMVAVGGSSVVPGLMAAGTAADDLTNLGLGIVAPIWGPPSDPVNGYWDLYAFTDVLFPDTGALGSLIVADTWYTVDVRLRRTP